MSRVFAQASLTTSKITERAAHHRPRGLAGVARLALLLTSALAILAGLSRTALAGGSARLLTPTVAESATHDWTLKVRIDLSQPPPTNHYTIKFSFFKNWEYEQTIEVRGQPPVMHRLPLNPPPKFKDEQVVDFHTDTNTGRVTKSVNWELSYKREDGFFIAGEYTMNVTTTDGDDLGTFNVTLNGTNDPVDRADIGFGSKVTTVASHPDAGTDQVAKNDDDGSGSNGLGKVTGSGNADPMVKAGAFNPTPEEIGDRPKGCGCSVPGLEGRGSSSRGLFGAFALGLVAMGAVVARLRRIRPL